MTGDESVTATFDVASSPSAPSLVSGPSVSSTTLGKTPSYSCSAVFSGSPNPSVSYQWLRGGRLSRPRSAIWRRVRMLGRS